VKLAPSLEPIVWSHFQVCHECQIVLRSAEETLRAHFSTFALDLVPCEHGPA
jgi:hypothetical protein